MANNIKLIVAGNEMLDPVKIDYQASIEEFSRSFQATFTDRHLNNLTRLLGVHEGDTAQLLINDQVVLDGFIDIPQISYDAEKASCILIGRSFHGQLVDCSAIFDKGRWRDSTLLQITNDLVRPYEGVSVSFDDSIAFTDSIRFEPFRRWAIQPEESVHECIRRAARLRGVNVLGDGKKGIVFSRLRPVATGASLVYGQNILSGRRTGRAHEVYTDYIVKSQSSGYKDWFGDDPATRGSVTLTDPGPIRRPLVIVSNGQGFPEDLQLRAQWERSVRAGRTRRVSYTTVGTNLPPPASGIWTPGQAVRVQDPWLDIDGDLLVISVAMVLSNDSVATELELGSSDAFAVLTAPKKRKKKPWVQ